MARRGRSREERYGDADESTIAQYLKERIYATITGLAIVLVYSTATEHHDPEQALFSLVIGVLGITAAGYLSDVIAHLATYKTFPDRAEQVSLVRIAFGALATVVTPSILLALAWAGVLELETALRVATIVYLVTLGAIGFGAVRRAELKWWQSLLVLAVLVLFGALVVGVQVLAHAV